MMSFGDEPWHSLGQRRDHPATAAEALEAANLDWDVMKVALYAADGEHSQRLDGHFGVVPLDRWGKPNCPVFGPVASDYRPLQNREAFAFFDPIVGEGAAIFHTAGAIDQGARIWIMAKLPDDIRVADKDITNKYLLLTNSHDGTSSVFVKFTPVRVVCKNTLTMALNSGPALRITHTREIERRLEDARRNLKLINTHYDRLERTFKGFTATPMDLKRLNQFVAEVYPEPKPDTKTRDAAMRRMILDRNAVTRLFEHGRGNDLPGVAGTLWAAYNAVTEYVDHRDTRRDGVQQLKYIWYGDGAAVKAKAFDVAVAKLRAWNPSTTTMFSVMQ